MSENNVNGIIGADVATTTGIVGATVAIGQYIVNDYVITIAEAEGDYGYTMTITRGTDTQTVTLHGLTPEQYASMLGYREQAQAAAQSAEGSASDAADYMRVALDAANSANSRAASAEQASNTARGYATQAETAKVSAETAKTDAQIAKTQALGYKQSAESAANRAASAATSAGNAQTAAETAQTAAETAESNAQTYAGQASQSATNAGQSATSAAQTLTQVQNEGASQIAAIDAEGQRVLDSIPADYSQMEADVTDLKSQIADMPDILDSTKTGIDLDVSDTAGNVILRLANGHIQTKNFDSSEVRMKPDIKESTKTGVDLDISDSSGNVIARLKDGYIQTKNFNSSEVVNDLAGKIDTQQSVSDAGKTLVVGADGAVTPVKAPANILNIFANKKLYHHQNQEVENPYIPAQSLFDVRYAYALGFEWIEVNPQKCSDGVFVCKHGLNGALGNGIKDAIGSNDYSEVKFEDVTSTWIRENVRYASSAEKYCGCIPTLDEFAAECKKFGMGIHLRGHEAAAIARNYMPEEKIWITDTERGTFRGTIERGWKNTVPVDERIAECVAIGAPVTISISNTQFPNYTDAEITELVQKAHANGFIVGINYPVTPYDLIRGAKLGVDYAMSSECAINPFRDGRAVHITSPSDSSLTLTSGAVYDSTTDTISMETGSKVSCAGDIVCGKTSLVLRYSGTLTITAGKRSSYNQLRNLVSDGSDYVFLANVLPHSDTNWAEWFEIEAKAQTTVYELTCDCDVVE